VTHIIIFASRVLFVFGCCFYVDVTVTTKYSLALSLNLNAAFVTEPCTIESYYCTLLLNIRRENTAKESTMGTQFAAKTSFSF
jgi:hypothetical protein